MIAVLQWKDAIGLGAGINCDVNVCMKDVQIREC